MIAPQAARYTQCTSCLTLFRIDARHLRAAGGRVRCGLCGERFDAWHALAERLPSDLPMGPEACERLPRYDAAVAPARASSEPGPAGLDATGPRKQESDWRYATAMAMESAAAPARRRRWPWALGCLLALLVLAGQWFWFQREALAQDPAWRPWIVRLCATAGCTLPPAHRPMAVAVVARTLRAHPAVSDALLFTATLVNRADAPQVWPQLGLTLLGIDGRALGQRWFTPREYLVDHARLPGPMPAGQPVPVRLEIKDPGAGAVGFEIAFR